MGILSVFDLQEKLVRKQGARAICPYCGGPVMAMDFDAHLFVCCIPVSHKNKTKFYCAVCSRRLIPQQQQQQQQQQPQQQKH